MHADIICEQAPKFGIRSPEDWPNVSGKTSIISNRVPRPATPGFGERRTWSAVGEDQRDTFGYLAAWFCGGTGCSMRQETNQPIRDTTASSPGSCIDRDVDGVSVEEAQVNARS